MDAFKQVFPKKGPPPLPPRKNESGLEDAKKVLAQVNSAPGFDDDSHNNEEKSQADDRLALNDRLQKYYFKWESERVHQGIGHIVDWALANGVDVLNERLALKYGESLDEFEESEKMVKEQPKDSMLDTLSSPSLASFPATPGNSSVKSYPSQSTIRERLLNFYSKYDVERQKKGVDDLVDYVARKGLGALNKKLVSKYGVTLEQFEASAGSTAAISPKIVADATKRYSLRSLLRRSQRKAEPEPLPGKVPAYVRPLLELFYTKYDQSKITSGGVNAIYRWTERHGVNALNAQLRNKYLEDLDGFADRMNRLREDLVDFYTIHEPSKLEGDGVNRILRWGVRNGRAAINKQLRMKYKCDLEEKNPSNLMLEEPDF
mmetsp:Transcript_4402/g.8325  ORF Transcript_4402/g.8325 Transcript_4402/m.8325 type:complete len:375 (-) Transcript_4402:194-1318(-)